MKVYPLMLAGMVSLSTAALAEGGSSWKLLVHHYDGTSSVAQYLTRRDCEYVRARLLGNHPYDLGADHLDDEVKAAKCFHRNEDG